MFKPDSEVKGYNTKDKADASAKENWLVLQIRKEILRKRPQFGITFLHLLFLLENVNKFYNNQPFFVTECLLSENDLMFLNGFWVKDKALKHLSKFIGWVNKRFCIQIDVILFLELRYRLYVSLLMLYDLFILSDVQRYALGERPMMHTER